MAPHAFSPQPGNAPAPQSKPKFESAPGKWQAPGGSWKCSACLNVNFPTRTACNRCGKSVHESAAGLTLGAPRAALAGDSAWACPACHNQNYPGRVICNRCSLPRPGPTLPTFAASATPLLAGGFHPPHLSWRCADDGCRNINFPTRTACNKCGAARAQPQGRATIPPAALQHPGCWVCPDPACSNVNFPTRMRCNRCDTLRPAAPLYSTPPTVVSGLQRLSGPSAAGQPQFPGGSWRCAGCRNVNFPQRTQCNRCQAARPGAAPARFAPY
eukprot:EG_transcript_16079